MIDSSKIGSVAMDFIDELLERYGDEENINIGDIVMVAEIEEVDSDGEEHTHLDIHSTNYRRHVQHGILYFASEQVDEEVVDD